MGGVAALKVSVVIPTRGDVDLTPITSSYDGIADEVLIWDNSKREDLAVYGRYAMIAEARNELILTQDDDCVVSEPQAIVAEWLRGANFDTGTKEIGERQFDEWPGVAAREVVVCNMPPEFRHDFYTDHALAGFGACFHRDAPGRAFRRFGEKYPLNITAPDGYMEESVAQRTFLRTCDIVFTALTPRVLVDVPYTNLWWAEDETRMYRQPQHIEERMRMLELVRKVRDAS